MGGEECNATAAPRVSISNGLIAYGIDDAGPQRPYGSRILVRSLTDGTTLRDLATATHVLSLEMWGTTVAWLEADGNWPTNLPLRVSTPPHPAAQDVEVFSTPGDQMAWALPRFSLQGGSLAWERYGTGQVWRRDLVAGAQQQVSPAGSACMLGGIEAGNVVMNCGSDTSRLEQNSTDAPWLIVWAVDTGPDLVLGLPPLQTEELSNGWIVVMPVNQQSLQAFPISSLMGQEYLARIHRSPALIQLPGHAKGCPSELGRSACSIVVGTRRRRSEPRWTRTLNPRTPHRPRA
jgi:hypothetical protein